MKDGIVRPYQSRKLGDTLHEGPTICILRKHHIRQYKIGLNSFFLSHLLIFSGHWKSFRPNGLDCSACRGILFVFTCMSWNNSFDTFQLLYLDISRILRYAKLLAKTLYIGVEWTTETTQKINCWREIKCLMRQIFYRSYPTHLESGSLGCLNPQYEEGARHWGIFISKFASRTHALSAVAVLHATVPHSVV
jgi:hypothetical protein